MQDPAHHPAGDAARERRPGKRRLNTLAPPVSGRLTE